MVSPLGVGIVVVYLSLKYGVVVAPDGRPPAASIAAALPPVAAASSLLLSADHEPAYAAALTAAAALPLGLPQFCRPVVGLFASTVVAVRAFATGHIVVGTLSAAATAAVAGFIAVTPSLR